MLISKMESKFTKLIIFKENINMLRKIKRVKLRKKRIDLAINFYKIIYKV